MRKEDSLDIFYKIFFKDSPKEKEYTAKQALRDFKGKRVFISILRL